jgi:hypothetical protein
MPRRTHRAIVASQCTEARDVGCGSIFARAYTVFATVGPPPAGDTPRPDAGGKVC